MNSKRFLLAALALAAFTLPARAATITLNAPSSVTAGSPLDIVVKISNVFQTHPGDALAGFGFNVVIGNPSLFSYIGETIGPLFDDFSGFPGSPDVVGLPTAGFLVAADFTEPLTLATLHFQAIGSGSTLLGISTDLSDPNQGLFYSTAGANPLNASTTVTATPEPGAALLGGLGLGLLVVYRRRAVR